MFKKICNIFSQKPKIIVVLGQTATGKTSLSIELAKKYNGEIISADSRQIYRGLDLGSGKVTPKEAQDIPHYMIDVANPETPYTVFEFQKKAQGYIDDILKRKKTPIICGGTGMYIDALVYDQKFPEIAPDEKLREELQKLSPEELLERLKQLDEKRASSIDPHNTLRIIRAIEIKEHGGAIPVRSERSPYKVLWVGLCMEKEELEKRIYKRILSRIQEGMIDEVKNLIASKQLSHERAFLLGLEYRYISEYLKGNLSYEEMLSTLFSEIKKFAKRQMTWFKRNKKIHWFHPQEEKHINNCVEKFLK